MLHAGEMLTVLAQVDVTGGKINVARTCTHGRWGGVGWGCQGSLTCTHDGCYAIDGEMVLR